MDLSENTENSISDTTTAATVRGGDHSDTRKRGLEEISGTHTTNSIYLYILVVVVHNNLGQILIPTWLHYQSQTLFALLFKQIIMFNHILYYFFKLQHRPLYTNIIFHRIYSLCNNEFGIKYITFFKLDKI